MAQTKALRASNEQLQAENEQLKDELEFWMSEDDGEIWPVENAEWRKIISIPKDKRTSEQMLRVQKLASIIRWKTDEKLQYERAEQIQTENKKLKEEIEKLQLRLIED